MATDADVRKIALSLPETTERPTYGKSPGFRVKDKLFLRIRTEAEGGLVVFVSDLGEKEALLQSEPKKFFQPPHLVSSWILNADANHEPFWMLRPTSGVTSSVITSPGRRAATSTQPPAAGAV